MHESQSRTWENLVGRSRGFWEFSIRVCRSVPATVEVGQGGHVLPAINKVQRSLIRTDSDEVTYNLHPIIRFDLELQLLEGKLAVRDLPEAWRARYTSDIASPRPMIRTAYGRTYTGTPAFGGSFQGYTLGNIMGASLRAGAEAAPESPPRLPRVTLPRCTTGWRRISNQHGQVHRE